MTKFSLKIVLIRLRIGFYRGLSFLGAALVMFGRWVGSLLWGMARVTIVPIIHLVYRIFFSIRLRFLRLTAPLRVVVMQLFGHRHALHFIIGLVVAFTSVVSLGTRAARAEDLGKKSVLYALISTGGDELIEERATDISVTYPTSYLVDVAAVSRSPEIDFDYYEESYVATTPTVGAIGAVNSTVSSPSEAPRTEIIAYSVAEGDTVSAIAEKFSISIETVLWTNNLTVRSLIRPGNELKILPTNGVQHTVKKGETLQKIANRYNAETKDIIAWNKLGDEGSLQIGETLLVPGGRPPAPPAPARVSSPTAIFAQKPAGQSAQPSITKMQWPVAAQRITQYFGWRHTGVDIAGPSGTAIYAAEDGIVEYAGWSNGYGQNVVINHGNGLRTRYAHASKIYVSKGDQVKRGEVIEAVGSTGRSTGPHLHFEVYTIGSGGARKFRNPFDYIR